MEQKNTEWKIEVAELVFLDLRTITSVGIEIKVILAKGGSIECVLPLFTHPETVEKTKQLMAEHIDPYEIKEYVRSSVEAMVKFKSAISYTPKNKVENYIRFTEGIIYNIESEED